MAAGGGTGLSEAQDPRHGASEEATPTPGAAGGSSGRELEEREPKSQDTGE